MVSEFRPDAGTTNTTDDRHYSILIADDDRGTREALSELLQNRGFKTVQAADGGEAVELVQVELVHLALFDMHMPRMTGLEAVTYLRHLLGRVFPAVLMTADATTDLMRQAFLAQVYSVIPKPVNTNIVLHTLARALSQVYGNRPDPTRPPAPDEAHTGGTGEAPRPTDRHGPRRPTDEDRPAE